MRAALALEALPLLREEAKARYDRNVGRPSKKEIPVKTDREIGAGTTARGEAARLAALGLLADDEVAGGDAEGCGEAVEGIEGDLPGFVAAKPADRPDGDPGVAGEGGLSDSALLKDLRQAEDSRHSENYHASSGLTSHAICGILLGAGNDPG